MSVAAKIEVFTCFVLNLPPAENEYGFKYIFNIEGLELIYLLKCFLQNKFSQLNNAIMYKCATPVKFGFAQMMNNKNIAVNNGVRF